MQFEVENISDNLEAATKQLNKHRISNQESRRNKVRTSQINRAKSREKTERPLPTKHSSETNSIADSVPDFEDDTLLNTLDIEISFEHLKVFEGTEPPQSKGHKRKKPKKNKTKISKQKEDDRKTELMKVLCTGNVQKLKELLDSIGHDIENNLNICMDLKNNFLNEALDEDGNSIMHIAALNEHTDLVKFLLANNSDPCLKNKKNQTPYSCTSSKEVREAMKEFARENPDKHNYNKVSKKSLLVIT